MNIVSSTYYWFSPQIANYEREQQPRLKFIVKNVLDALLGIVNFAVQVHLAAAVAAVAGALALGEVANETISLIYLRQATVSKGLQKNFGIVCKISIAILLNSMAPTIVGMITGRMQLLMGSTSSLLVIILATIVSSNCTGSLATGAYRKFASGRHR
jgi:hypothetical protein